MKVSMQGSGDRREKLTPDDIVDGNSIVLTLDGLVKVELSGDACFVARFAEAPDKELWLNTTSMNRLIERYGDETDDWIGFPVVLVVTVGDYKGKPFRNLWVASASEWDAVISPPSVKKSFKR